MIKKIGWGIGKGILLIIVVALLYLLSAFLLSRITVNQNISADKELDIYILTNGIHTDIVVPSVTEHINWFSMFTFLDPAIDHSIYNYVAIGWGDKGFYLNTPTWAELKVSTALKACIGVSGTAMHVTYYPSMRVSERCRKLSISKKDYKILIEYILNSLTQDQNKKAIKIPTDAIRGNVDAFYEANGRYNIFNSCNTWANRGLKHANQKACLWTIFQKPIFNIYKIGEG